MRRTWPRPRPLDGWLALALTAMAQVELLVADDVQGPLAVQHLAFAVMTIPVAWRRSAPLASVVGAAAGLAVQTVAGDAPVVAGFIALLVVTASVGAHPQWRRAVAGLAVVVASANGVFLLTRPAISFADEAGNLAILVLLWGIGRAVRVSTDRAVAAERRAVEAEHEAAAGVLQERRRIALDLHDSVAHGVTAMLLHVGAVRQVLDAGDHRDALASAETAGRQALSDMQQMLHVMAEDTTPDLPGLVDLEPLAERTRAAGLDVVLRLAETIRAAPPSVQAVGFRVAQEGLTNALRHAGASCAHVEIGLSGDVMTVAVVDDGGPAGASGPEPRVPGGGNGLAGLRERVAVFGGSLDAGPRPEGGWAVHARIPLAAS